MLEKLVPWFLMENQTEKCTTAYHELLQHAKNDTTFLPDIIIIRNETGIWLQFRDKTNVPVGGAVTTLAKESKANPVKNQDNADHFL